MQTNDSLYNESILLFMFESYKGEDPLARGFSTSYDLYNPDKMNREERQEREKLRDFLAFFAGLAVQKVGVTFT